MSGRTDTALWFAPRFLHENQPLPLSLLYRLAPSGTSYAAAAMAMLDSALGTDFGLSSLHAFSETAQYRLHVEGPSGQCFNYADAVADQPLPPCFSWLASRFRHAHAAVHAAPTPRSATSTDSSRCTRCGLRCPTGTAPTRHRWEHVASSLAFLVALLYTHLTPSIPWSVATGVHRAVTRQRVVPAAAVRGPGPAPGRAPARARRGPGLLPLLVARPRGRLARPQGAPPLYLAPYLIPI